MGVTAHRRLVAQPGGLTLSIALHLVISLLVVIIECYRYVAVADDDTGDEYLPCPDFSKYLYFLFAPTLVYRDVYPR